MKSLWNVNKIQIVRLPGLKEFHRTELLDFSDRVESFEISIKFHRVLNNFPPNLSDY